MTGISRKAALLAAVILLPLVAAIALPHGGRTAVFTAMLWGGLGIVFAWTFARRLSRRIRELTAFSDRMPAFSGGQPRLPGGDDEIGELARSLSRMAPKVEEVLNGLGIELARREAILATVPEAVLAVDARLHISFCNQAFIQTVGGHGITEGVPLLKVLRDPGLLQVLERVIRSGETVRQQLRIPVPESRSFEVYATPLATSTSSGALAVLHDISPQERLERTRRDFVANVSHEFRTPLATIAGYTETLLDGGLEDEQNRRKFVEIIQANSVRLNNIAADLLVLSQLETGPGPEPLPVAVADVIQGALRAIEPVARVHDVRLRCGSIPDVRVLGHRMRFEQAVLNLLDNAVKFNKPSGEVTVEANLGPGDQIEITVRDTGTGIPQEDLPRIFERFYRVDKARSRQVGGTGLGLSIVKHAIDQMHGTVRVESQIGKGSRFTIQLPALVGPG